MIENAILFYYANPLLFIDQIPICDELPVFHAQVHHLATVHPGSVPAGPRRARGGMGSVGRARAGPRSPRSPRARGARRARREPAESPCKSWLSAMLLRVKAYPLLCVSIFVIGVGKSWPELRR